MRFVVLDVGHGFCGYSEAENGGIIVFDCGHKTQPEIRPSRVLPRPRHPLYQRPVIERLFITNFDEDHISDIRNLRSNYDIQILHKNPSISAAELRQIKLKTGPITPSMESCIEMLESYTGSITQPPSLPGLSWTQYWNQYATDFDDTNNLSLVTFLDIGGMTALIPGDLERDGWLKLLERQDFRSSLGNVSIFVASHHGRENGYCKDVFDYCSPYVFVFSDSAIVHATQEMTNTYSNHARGINYNGKPRKVLTTRSDGTVDLVPG